ncbi:hypothetical protein NECAME_13984 [Necator americanus]|uniref:Uncharacterized protein n=1 Tax=Necator americanus TaxID=51031 RepID=W2STS9_NECAM|nr:hypothetical protein NECAME_13984 [Necator americanus]ETN72107.1 hypothetical protein NECAME_13984 [Necator americanus]
MFDGAEVRAAIHGDEHATHTHRRVGGGKRGRLVVIGRGLHGRGRIRFRPTTSHHMTPRIAEETPIADKKTPVAERHDAVTETEEHAVQTELDSATREFVTKDEVDDEDVVVDSTPEVEKKLCHKINRVPKKMPFVGSGQKGDSTFSIAGNQQQVMKIIGTRFQEWLPVVRSIIYDARCKDYAKALQRDLARQKRSHAEQLRILEMDLEDCRNDSERREIYADVIRLKQQWTSKHDRVLARLNEHISKGGVWSKVQQLRTIYAALLV